MTRPTLMLPTTFALMKSFAYAARITYAKYHSRETAVTGRTHPRYRRRRSWNSGDCWTATNCASLGEGGTRPASSCMLMDPPDLLGRGSRGGPGHSMDGSALIVAQI